MKTKSFLLIFAMLGLVFYSCVEDKEICYVGSESIVFDAYVAQAENTPQPMAFESSWENNDAIGIFMTSGAGLTTIVDGAENKKFATPDGDGQFWNIDADNAIHYPKDGSKVNFIAYYPYSTALVNNVYKVDVKDQASQAAIDLMYSDNAKDYSSASTGKPQLEFIHQLTKVVFNIEGVGGLSSLEGLKIEIENMAGTADFDLATKTLTAGALDSKIEVKTTIDAANPLKALSEGIVIPTAAAARKFIFTLKVDGQLKSFEWDASAQPFEAGKKNTYPVKLDAKLGALVQPGATIKPWEDGSSEDIEIDLSGGTEQLGEGTEANPYTIAGATANVGQNEKWVTGYIVGSTTKTRAVGTPSKDNILLAPTAGETDESKCIVVDLVGSAVQANLDIVTYPELIGASVKVKGNIVNDLFGGILSLTAVTAQVGGKEITPPEPEASLLFPGSDFEDWNAFTNSLAFNITITEIAQAEGGRNGGKALSFPFTVGTKNVYAFTIKGHDVSVANPTKISFYIKGSVGNAKSLSINVYNEATETYFNLGDCSTDKTLTSSGTNNYDGTIDTKGEWVKITLDVTGYKFSASQEKMFSIKVGKTGIYDLLIDDITIE